MLAVVRSELVDDDCELKQRDRPAQNAVCSAITATQSANAPLWL